jgi:hypothetical protein
MQPAFFLNHISENGVAMRRIAGANRLGFGLLILGLLALQSVDSSAACRTVGASDKILINATSQRNLARVGITRDLIFASLKDVSIPETSGCWSGVTGNFDDQIVSAGVLQWNYGQKSLQPIMLAYQAQFATDRAYEQELTRIMPTHGKLVFSRGCLTSPITDDCRNAIISLQPNNRLQLSLKQEFDALFESDAMVQVQTDRFVKLLESVRDDLQRLFPNMIPSVRKIKWAIDTKVQQGGFPGDADIARTRSAWSGLDSQERLGKLHSLITWYQGLSNAPDQGGTSRVADNARAWNQKISSNALSDEQVDLLQLTFLKSRTAQGQSGRWQALTFQRRAKIIFGIGCVAGECTGI